MLPINLLRARSRKGTIFPSFCDQDGSEQELAEKIIAQYQESAKTREKRKLLDSRIRLLESQYEDYKMVRGFAALLERRCEFKQDIPPSRPDIARTDPADIRRSLFEESSKRGYALTDLERNEIMNTVASKIGLSIQELSQAMWSDFEENMVLDRFDTIGATDLVRWYNLSLMQTMLFNCTKLEFHVHGGSNWKRILRKVKRLGLMYHLNLVDLAADVQKGKAEPLVSCSIEGPLSLFKLTDRYGTSIAKLIPSIVQSEKWSLDATIVRKTMEGKKIYQFTASNDSVPELMDPFTNDGKTRAEEQFDSIAEERFAQRFAQSANGWSIAREPDPLIVAGGKAMIPDFVFEKYGRRVYLEIVGFWTKEYLERKVQKMLDIVAGEKKVDLFVAISEDLACSKLALSMQGGRIIPYRNDTVPVKPIVDYLKSVDREMLETSPDNDVVIEMDTARDVIPVAEVAQKYNMLPEMVTRIVGRRQQGGNADFIVAGVYLISRHKMDELSQALQDITKFVDACSILQRNSIPEACHAELVSKLGYDVIWTSMDPGSAVLTKKATVVPSSSS